MQIQVSDEIKRTGGIGHYQWSAEHCGVTYHSPSLMQLAVKLVRNGCPDDAFEVHRGTQRIMHGESIYRLISNGRKRHGE